jgi:hypothetical protein
MRCSIVFIIPGIILFILKFGSGSHVLRSNGKVELKSETVSFQMPKICLPVTVTIFLFNIGTPDDALVQNIEYLKNLISINKKVKYHK